MSWTLQPEIQAAVTRAAQERGLDPRMMATMAWIESRGNPNAQNPNSSAGGLFQQLDANAREYGVANRFDPNQSAAGAGDFAVANRRYLSGALGRELQPWEYYFAHQQGPGGARRLLADPNARAADIVGADAVRLNGGNVNMTAGEFAGIWRDRFNRYYSQAGGDPGQPINAGPAGGPIPAQALRASGPPSDDAFNNALQRLGIQREPMTGADRMAAVGRSLVNLDQGVVAPIQPLTFPGAFQRNQR